MDDESDAHLRGARSAPAGCRMRGGARRIGAGGIDGGGADRGQRGGHHRVPAGERAALSALSGSEQAADHREHHLSGGLPARGLRRDRHGASAGASGVQGLHRPPAHRRRTLRTRRLRQRHDVGGPHQLLRDLSGERGQPGLGLGPGVGPDGELVHRRRGSGIRDDGGAQRVGGWRKQPAGRAGGAGDVHRLPVAQLRQLHHRRTVGHRERAARTPARLLPQVLPAGQRGAGGVRALRPGAGGRVGGGALRNHPAPRAHRRQHAVRDVHRRTAPGRRAQRDAAAGGRRAVGSCGLPHSRRLGCAVRSRGGSGESIEHPARRPALPRLGGARAGRFDGCAGLSVRRAESVADDGRSAQGRQPGRCRRGDARHRAWRGGRTADRGGGEPRQDPVRGRLRPGFQQPAGHRLAAERVGGDGRLAAAVSASGPGRGGDAGGCFGGGARLSAAGQPHARLLPSHGRDAAPGGDSGTAGRGCLGGGLPRPGSADRGRGVRADAGEHREPHAQAHPRKRH